MTSSTETDEIVREIIIESDPQVVFALASTPGWWINDGEVVEHRIDRDEHGCSVVHDPTHGDFVIEGVDSRPDEYVAFRWLTGPDADSATLVEFFIEPVDDRSVRLRVRESGFASLDVSAEERRKRVDDNTEGWVLELAALTRALGRAAGLPGAAERGPA